MPSAKSLIYRGAKVGLMGALADACPAAGGAVTGVIPQALREKELAHSGWTGRHLVKSMHERKATMAELAGAFVALPGGFGMFEEFFEMVTDRAVEDGFLRPAEGPREVLDKLLQWISPETAK